MNGARIVARLVRGVCLVLAACGSSDADPPATPESSSGKFGKFPSAEELPVKPELPDIFQSFDGTRRATTPEDMKTWRAEELRTLFAHYIYGAMPPAPKEVLSERVASADDLLGGKATYEELALRFSPSDPPLLHVAIFAPKGKTAAPAILGLNKCGNQSVTADARVRPTTTFLNAACAAGDASGRGGMASSWSLETIIDRGFALVTYHESDAAPDDAAHDSEGLRAHLIPPGDAATHWGTIATWSFAMHRIMDVLPRVPAVDAQRVAVFGHSRRGKAALWAAATDPRIKMVIAHQSGTAGAALSRSKVGESIAAITTLFPHWFDDVFPTFANEEDRIPVDQHQLLALLAPRPVLVSDGQADEWADPPGARAAVEAADAAWKLFGAPGIVRDASGTISKEGTLVWTIRPGGHAVESSDWTTFLDFASRHFQ